MTTRLDRIDADERDAIAGAVDSALSYLADAFYATDAASSELDYGIECEDTDALAQVLDFLDDAAAAVADAREQAEYVWEHFPRE